MKKILLTGGLGFIFSHVAEYLSQQGYQITIIDNLSDGSHPELQDELTNVNFIIDDINNIMNYDIACDVIIHAAAESNVDKSIEDQSAFMRSNVLGTHQVLEFARRNNTRVFYCNTDEVYGPTETWCTPKDILNPSNPYSASKAAAGHLCWSYHNTYNLPVQEIRMCNIIGKRQATTKLLPRVIEYIKLDREIPLYDGGTNTREYMDVRDVGPLIELVLKSNQHETFNLTYNQELSILEVIKAAEKILNKRATTIPATRLGHDKRYRMTPHKIMFNEVGQKHKFHKIEDTIHWMMENT